VTDFTPGETFYFACLKSRADPRPCVHLVEYVRDAGRGKLGPSVRIKALDTGLEQTVPVSALFLIRAEADAAASRMRVE
jgi:hypothetical protein